MKLVLSENEFRNLVSKSVRRILSESELDDMPNLNGYDEDAKRSEIDAAWEEFDKNNKYNRSYDDSYANPNIGNATVPGYKAMNAQSDYIHTNASNIGDSIRNFSHNYAQGCVGHASPEDGTSYGIKDGYNQWDAALDDTNFDDGFPAVNGMNWPTTRFGFETKPLRHDALLESCVRKAVRKVIRRATR